MISPHAWLAREPLQPGEQLFVVLGDASDCRPLEAWRQAGGAMPSAIWADEYATWDEVMPYVALVAVDSPFLDWIAECEGTDWGWLAVSAHPLHTVVEHLRSLTKVYLPQGPAVFLRFWDGDYLLPILQGLGPGAGEMLAPLRRYWINGQPHAVAGAVTGAVRASPWWVMPAQLLKQLDEQFTRPLEDNLLQWLEEQRPDLHAAFTPATLRRKVAYFARQPAGGHQALATFLAAEMG